MEGASSLLSIFFLRFDTSPHGIHQLEAEKKEKER